MVVLIIGVMAMTGCEDSKAPSNALQTLPTSMQNEQHEEISMNSKEKIAVLDSINIVNSRVDELLAKIETQTSIIDKNQTNIDEIKKSSSISTLVSWSLAVISMILAIIALIKGKSAFARAKRHRAEIEQLKQSLLDMERNIANGARYKSSGSSTLSNRDYMDLSYRISKLERLYTQQQTPTASTIEIGGRKNPAIPQPQVPTQRGYFGLPSQMSMTEAYFKTFDEIRDSDSRFTVEIKDGKALFEPLLESTKLLNGIKSGDVIKFALEFQGCALSDATQMKVMSAGEAIKKDGIWIITKKALISLVR